MGLDAEGAGGLRYLILLLLMYWFSQFLLASLISILQINDLPAGQRSISSVASLLDHESATKLLVLHMFVAFVLGDHLCISYGFNAEYVQYTG